MEITSSSPNKCWEETIKYLLKFGQEKILYQREYLMITNVTYVLNNIEEELLHDSFLISDKFKKFYCSSFELKNPGIEIKRVFNYGEKNFNQYEAARDAIMENDSIRIPIICVQEPQCDYVRNGAPKCLINIHFIVSGSNKLSAICNYTSSNMAIFNLLDIHQLHKFLQQMAKDTQKTVGELIMHFDRVFIWKADLVIYKKYLEGEV